MKKKGNERNVRNGSAIVGGLSSLYEENTLPSICALTFTWIDIFTWCKIPLPSFDEAIVRFIEKFNRKYSYKIDVKDIKG